MDASTLSLQLVPHYNQTTKYVKPIGELGADGGMALRYIMYKTIPPIDYIIIYVLYYKHLANLLFIIQRLQYSYYNRNIKYVVWKG